MTNYDKNIGIIKKRFPNFAKEIEESTCPEWLKLINDNTNFYIQNSSDKIFKAYNEEKKKELIKNLKKGELSNNELSVLIGIGTGELLYETLKMKHEKHQVLAIEPIPYFLKIAFEKYDYTKWLNNYSLMFASKEKESINLMMGTIESKMVIHDYHLIAEAYTIHRHQEYSEVINFTNEVTNQIRCNVGTVSGAGFMFAENDIKNLPYVYKHRGVAEIQNLYKNKTAVIVSTGPSLQKNIHILAQMKEKVIIIAVAQALRALLAYGIKPDFICTVDYGEINLEHFEGLMNTKDVPLVALNRSYAPILKRWKGQKFITVSQAPGYPDTVVNKLTEKGSLLGGGSVSHCCLGLAVHLGCKNIGIIGQDLAYSPEEKQSHTPLADAGGKVEIKEGLLSWDVTDPNSKLHGKKSIMGSTKYVEGYFGNVVPTNFGLASFILGFENIVRMFPSINIMNCTEGGAHIKGTDRISLRKFIKKYGCKVNRRLLNKYLSEIENPEKLKIEIIELLNKEIKVFDKIIDKTQQALDTHRLILKKRIQKDNKKFKHYVGLNEKYSDEAEKLARANPLLTLYIYSVSRRIQAKDLKIDGRNMKLLKKREILETRMKRNKLILEAANNSSKKLRKLYEEQREILLNCYDNINMEYEKVNFDKAVEYIRAGNWANPLVASMEVMTNPDKYTTKEMETALQYNKIGCAKLKDAIIKAKKEYDEREKQIDYTELIYKGKEVGREKEDFKSAKKYIDKALKLIPDGFDALWGLASTYSLFRQMNKAIEIYDRLLKKYPDIKRIKFERAVIKMYVEKEKAIPDLEAVIKESDEFNHHYSKLGDLYIKEGNLTKGIECFEKYLKYFPINENVQASLKAVKSFKEGKGKLVKCGDIWTVLNKEDSNDSNRQRQTDSREGQTDKQNSKVLQT